MLGSFLKNYLSWLFSMFWKCAAYVNIWYMKVRGEADIERQRNKVLREMGDCADALFQAIVEYKYSGGPRRMRTKITKQFFRVLISKQSVDEMLKLFTSIENFFEDEDEFFNNQKRYPEPLPKLIRIKYTTGQNQDECSICLEAYTVGKRLVKLSCSHLFHLRCIQKWLHIRKRCPYCRHRVVRCTSNLPNRIVEMIKEVHDHWTAAVELGADVAPLFDG